MFTTGRGDVSWFEERRYQWEKVCAGAGDLVVWDSRTPHYNVSGSSLESKARFAAYLCYIPVSAASQEDLRRKREAFEKRMGTIHWPDATVVRGNETWIKGVGEAGRRGVLDPMNRLRPKTEPRLGERASKLMGIPYIRE